MAWTRTFAQMKTDIGLETGVDPDSSNPNTTRLPDDVRSRCIQEARRELGLRRDLRLLQASDTITAGVGDHDYGLPSDWGRPYYAVFLDSSCKKVEPPFITREEYDDRYIANTSSDRAAPEHICIYGEEYLLGPVPDASYSIYIRYYKVPADITSEDTFLTTYWDAIFWMACLRAIDYLMEDTRRGLFQQREKRAIDAVSIQDAVAKWSGRRLQSRISRG